MKLLSKLSLIVGHVVRWIWVAGLSFLLFCHLNHGRFWWQELVCSFTLYWAPFVGLGFVLTLYRSWRGRDRLPWSILVFALQIVLLAIVLNLARPYLLFGKWPVVEGSHVAELRVLVAPFSDGDTVWAGVDEAIRQHLPDLVVVIGAPRDTAERRLGTQTLPFVDAYFGARGAGIEILSKYPLRGERREGIGYAALPAVYEQVILPDENIVELGALSLSPLDSEDSFEDNKLTSRRIATLVRNSSRHRIVVGRFFASPFSKIVSMYTRQGRLRSVMFGRGFPSTWDMQSSVLRIPADHAFVSRHMRVDDVVLVDLSGSRHRGLFFRVSYEPRK